MDIFNIESIIKYVPDSGFSYRSHHDSTVNLLRAIITLCYITFMEIGFPSCLADQKDGLDFSPKLVH